MRQGQNQNQKRSRGRGRKPQNPLSRSMESNGPDVKIRGTANHIFEKYQALARDAQSSGDRIAAENYLQHAEHYHRLIVSAQAQQEQNRQEQQDRQNGNDRNDQSDDNGSSDNDANEASDDETSSAKSDDDQQDDKPAPRRRAPRRRRTADKADGGDKSATEDVPA